MSTGVTHSLSSAVMVTVRLHMLWIAVAQEHGRQTLLLHVLAVRIKPYMHACTHTAQHRKVREVLFSSWVMSMLCHPEPFWKCCDTEPLCFSDTLVPEEPPGSQAENVSLYPTYSLPGQFCLEALRGQSRGNLSLFSPWLSLVFLKIFLYNHGEMFYLEQNHNSYLKCN